MEEKKKIPKRKQRKTLVMERDRLLKEMANCDPAEERYKILNDQRVKIENDLIKYKEIKTNRNTQVLKTGGALTLGGAVAILEAGGKLVIRNGFHFMRGIIFRGL